MSSMLSLAVLALAAGPLRAAPLSPMLGREPRNITSTGFEAQARWTFQIALLGFTSRTLAHGSADGNAGACGSFRNDDELLVGLTTALYGNPGVKSVKCDRKIEITSLTTGKVVTATVVDACTGFCGDKDEDLILSIGAYSALQENAFDLGILDVSWKWLDAGTPASSPYIRPSSPVSPPSPAISKPVEEVNPAPTPSSTMEQQPEPTPSKPVAEEPTQPVQPSAAPPIAGTPPSPPPVNESPPSSPPPPSGGKVYTGSFATYYEQNGVAGHCGETFLEDAMIAALPTETFYDGGSRDMYPGPNCGRWLRVWRDSTGQFVDVRAMDSCPTCVSNAAIDLSQGAYDQLGTREEGQFRTTWMYL